MANDVAITAGSGVTVATEDIGSGRQVQLVKPVFGAAGSATDVSSTNPFPVVGTSTTVPDNTAAGLGVRPIGEDIVCADFTDVGSSLLSTKMTQLNLGTGMGVTQSSGNLLVTTGTTANADFLARSTDVWRGSWQMKQKTVLSQRIANNNFWTMLADFIGSSLAVTVNSTTSISVTKTAHGFTSTSVGQFICIGAMTLAGCPPGRYAIASIPDANTINFTVAGFPASGSTTCTLFGWSYCKVSYSGVTATNAFFDCQRRGWATGDTTLTINTTASPGHVVQMNNNGRDVTVHDTLVASTTTPNVTTRGSRVDNIPDDNLDLYVFLWAFNGTSAPASTTTWTLGFWSMEKFANLPVYIQGQRMQGTAQPMPVQIGAGAAAIGSVSISSGTVTTVSTVTAVSASTPAVTTTTTNTLSSAATNNATSVKASAGTLYGIACSNIGAAAAFVKIFNKASAPTVGTDVPVLTIPIAASGVQFIEFGPMGIRLSLGIAFCITNLVADSDTTAVAAAQVKVMTAYI